MYGLKVQLRELIIRVTAFILSASYGFRFTGQKSHANACDGCLSSDLLECRLPVLAHTHESRVSPVARPNNE